MYRIVLIFLILYPMLLSAQDSYIPELKNEMPDDHLKLFKQVTQRQAARYSDTFFLSKAKPDHEIALTFDDGPDTNTAVILDILKKYNKKATFFLLGRKMEQFPEITKRIVDEGHDAACHSFSHPDYRKLTVEEMYNNQILKNHEILKDITGQYRPYIRPPFGAITDKQIEFLKNKNIKIINWSVDSFDWNRKESTPEEILDKFHKYLHDGAIILMHSPRSTTAEALPEILFYIDSKNYKCKTVSELLEIK